jgi:hypothetical protein
MQFDFGGLQVDFSFQDPLLILIAWILGIIIFLVILILIVRAILVRKAHLRGGAFEKEILLVTLPKITPEERGAPEETLQSIQEDIGVAETFLTAIGGMTPQKGFQAWLFGREDEVSFEIVADNGLIHFYIAVPKYLRQYLEEQLHAQYPDAQVEEVEDYNIFTPRGVILGSYLVFTRPNFFPIKTYRKLESEPLNALTNALSRVEEEDGAVIQFLVRSAPKGWRQRGISIAQQMQQGKKLSEVEGGKFLKGVGKSVAASVKSKPKDQSGLPQQPEAYRLSPLEEEMVRGLEEKASKAGLEVNIRVMVSSRTVPKAQMYLNNIINSFSQYNIYQYGNSLKKYIPKTRKRLVRDFIYRNFNENRSVILNTEEMASMFHLPGPWIDTPNIHWMEARKAAPPINLPKEGTKLGFVEYRGQRQDVYIKKPDRMRHLYTIGKSGTGKSNFMQNLAIQDIRNGAGVCVVDPHGDFADYVLGFIPKERVDDVIYFDPSDMERPVGLNMLEARNESMKDMAVQEMISIFYKLFTAEMIGPMFEHTMRNVMLTLMADQEKPGTIVEIPRVLTDQEYANEWIAKLKDPVVRAFWEKEMAKTSDFHKSEMLGYLISKVGRFVENEMMRNIIGQQKSGFNFREVMDQGKILIINLAKGKVGDVNGNLLGMIVVSKLQMAALGRADLPEEERKDFYLYIDEFQNFITESISIILSEARKYRLSLNIAHQYMGQLVSEKGDTSVRDAVLGNAGTIACFRIGPDDAQVLESEFSPVFSAHDLINVEKYTCYLKLLIDNAAAKPFNMKCFPPEKPNRELAEKIKQLSRLKYGRDRRQVEAEIMERAQLGETGGSSPGVSEPSI